MTDDPREDEQPGADPNPDDQAHLPAALSLIPELDAEEARHLDHETFIVVERLGQVGEGKGVRHPRRGPVKQCPDLFGRIFFLKFCTQENRVPIRYLGVFQVFRNGVLKLDQVVLGVNLFDRDELVGRVGGCRPTVRRLTVADLSFLEVEDTPQPPLTGH
jgi:hypothetical protein